MSGKITLITPPDFYENSNLSILLAHPRESDQDTISQWLGTNRPPMDINFYVYSGEKDIEWFLYSLNCCKYKYIDLDHCLSISQILTSYVLSKSNVYYKISNEEHASVLSHINSNRILKIEHFLERAIIEQRT